MKSKEPFIRYTVRLNDESLDNIFEASTFTSCLRKTKQSAQNWGKSMMEDCPDLVKSYQILKIKVDFGQVTKRK